MFSMKILETAIIQILRISKCELSMNVPLVEQLPYCFFIAMIRNAGMPFIQVVLGNNSLNPDEK